MRILIFLCLGALAGTLSAQKGPATVGGHPDIQGIWTNATLTPMERPASFAGKATALPRLVTLVSTTPPMP